MTNLKFLQKFFFFLLIGFSLCIMHACEPDPDPDPDPDEKLNELVGTWKYYFSSGYEVKCFNSDGTGYKQEYDEADGGWHSKDEFNYTYYKESGKLIITDKEDNKTYIYKVISLTSEILELEDPDGNLDTYYRVEGEIENPDTKNELVGTWKDYFSSGYVVKCFNSDGTGYEQEYDEADGGWYSKDEFNYTYYKESGKLIITDKEENKTYIYKVISLTSEILELEDPDGDLDTYYRVEGEIVEPEPDPSDKKRLVQIIEEDYESNGGLYTNIYNFDYDSKGRVISVTEYENDEYDSQIEEDTHTIEYSENSIICTERENSVSEVDNVVTFKLSDGKVIFALEEFSSFSYSHSYSYNSNYLTETTGGLGNATFTWSGDKLMETYENVEDDEDEYIFEYDGQTCKGYNPAIVLFFAHKIIYEAEIFPLIANPELIGFKTNLLPKSAKCGDEIVHFTYELNDDGYLRKCSIVENDGPSYEAYTFTWEDAE